MNRILVVMSDLFFSATINDAAKKFGASITVVQNEAKFQERLQDQPVALIFDLNCTTVDPVGLIAKAKADPATKAIPVICFYPHVQTDLAEKATAAGADTVLRRSVFVGALPELLAKASRSTPDPSVAGV
jgi:CheY-like chemotaxis protein